MQKTSSSFFAFVLALLAAGFLTEVSAQIRIKLPRPTLTKPTATPKTEPTASGRSIDDGAAATVQANKAAIEYDSLMNMRFYEESGGFLVEGLEVVFPPAGGLAAT